MTTSLIANMKTRVLYSMWQQWPEQQRPCIFDPDLWWFVTLTLVMTRVRDTSSSDDAYVYVVLSKCLKRIRSCVQDKRTFANMQRLYHNTSWLQRSMKRDFVWSHLHKIFFTKLISAQEQRNLLWKNQKYCRWTRSVKHIYYRRCLFPRDQ